MSRVIELLDKHISDCNNKIKESEKIAFLINNFDYKISSIIRYPFSNFLLIYYTCANIDRFACIDNIIYDYGYYFDKIKISDLDFLMLLYKEIQEKHNKDTFSELFIDEDYYEISLSNFETLDISNELKNKLKRIFAKANGTIDFEAYNTFLLAFLNKESIKTFNNIIELYNSIKTVEDNELNVDDTPLNLFSLTNNIMHTNNGYKGTINIPFEMKGLVNSQQKMNLYDKILSVLESLRDINDTIIPRIEKNSNILSSLNEIKRKIKKNQPINLYIYKSLLPNDLELRIELISYNNSITNKGYIEEKLLSNKLKNTLITKKENIILKYGINIDINKITISSDDLESKLKLLINHNEIIKYNNIMLKLLNNISYENLHFLLNLISENDIDEKFVLNNIDILVDSKQMYNFIYNITLLKKCNMNINNIRKFDYKILFKPHLILKNIIENYNNYGIKLDSECYNYECLNKDYSYIIDKYIEIGYYDLIKNNLSLINDNSIMIIKRAILYIKLNNSITNEQGKLRGSLRKEENFIVNDIYLNKTILENYETFIPSDILNYLKNNNEKIDISINLSILDEYLINKNVYNICGLYISKNKVINNLKILLKHNYDELYNTNELILYSIIYNYPMLLNKNIITDITNKLNEKAKLLILR